MTKIVSEIKVVDQIATLKSIIDDVINKDVFYVQGFFDYKPKPIFNSKKKLIKGRTIKDVNSPKKPQQRTIEKYDNIYSLLSPKKYSNGFPTRAGYYMFVANKDFDIKLRDVFYDFIALQIQNSDIIVRLLSTPKINLYFGEKSDLDAIVKIHKNEVFYVGQAKNIDSRYSQHVSDKLDKTSGLKLGIRSSIINNLDFYCQIIS
jgi:hypothetical protein